MIFRMIFSTFSGSWQTFAPCCANQGKTASFNNASKLIHRINTEDIPSLLMDTCCINQGYVRICSTKVRKRPFLTCVRRREQMMREPKMCAIPKSSAATATPKTRSYITRLYIERNSALTSCRAARVAGFRWDYAQTPTLTPNSGLLFRKRKQNHLHPWLTKPSILHSNMKNNSTVSLLQACRKHRPNKKHHTTKYLQISISHWSHFKIKGLRESPNMSERDPSLW